MKHRKRTTDTDAQKALMWEHWRDGWTLEQIAELFELSHGSVRGVLVQASGTEPANRSCSKPSLTLGEREEIARHVADGLTVRSMAALIGRAPSTVSREIQRNGGRSDYRAAEADSAAWGRALRIKQCEPTENQALP